MIFRRKRRPALLPDWKEVLKKAWSVRVLAILALLDFFSAVLLITIDGAAEKLIEDHASAVIAALAVKSILSVAGIWLRVRAQKEAEEIEEVAA